MNEHLFCPRRNAAHLRSDILHQVLWLLIGALGCWDCRPSAQAAAPDRVNPAIALQAVPFSLEDVRLLEGPFKHAMDLDREYVLSLDVDRLLHNFRVNAGLPSKAQPLGGWEEPKCELRGHFIGHYLSACALLYASTGDARLKEKGDAVVTGLAECQAKLGNGYLSAFPEAYFNRVEAQQRVWAPYYTLHKIYAGLLDMYVYGQNTRALETCKKFGDWVITRNAGLTDEQMQRMLGNEHGGMNEVLANLYALTGEQKYLRIARRFNHHAVIDPAASRQDKLTGLHANTQIPKFVGTARQYELTADESLRTASLFFWNTVVNERSYVIGGHSDDEHFSPKERLSQALGPSTTETCNTYNMLKLTRHLFAWNPQATYADYYERALYNHILASQNPVDGMTCYYVPLRSGSHKTYCGPTDSFWCCTGTGVENHAKYGDSIYFRGTDKDLYVNLFIASELNWKDRGLRLRQETGYPEEPNTRLIWTCEKPTEVALQIRHPAWARSGFEVRVNGRRQWLVSQPGSYATLSRTWRSGDTVEVLTPFSLRTEAFRDNTNRFAVLYGPLVLSAEVAANQPIPAWVGPKEDLLAELTPVSGERNTFACSASQFRRTGSAEKVAAKLEPFYKMHGDRHYVVYWDALTPAQWTAKVSEYELEQARWKDLEARSVDVVKPGDEQNEGSHAQAGANSSTGPFGTRHYRHATDGGWFSWKLKVQPDQPQQLVVTYWGGDTGRTFDLLVDGTKLATQRLQRNRPDQFYDESYPLPADLIKGKQKITLRFQAPPSGWAGGVFGVRVVQAGDRAGVDSPRASLTVQVDRPGAKISPHLWGIFFEDINLSADGGIYPELVRNLSFEESDQPVHWRLVSVGNNANELAIDTSKPLDSVNRRSLRVHFQGQVCLQNEGYWGMHLERGERYHVRLAARADQGFKDPLTISLEKASGQSLGSGQVTNLSDQWTWSELDLTASESDPAARLSIRASGEGTFWLDMVSVLPQQTWKNHGLRPDLCEMLADLRPAFMRFPGGCWVEGETMAHAYRWKQTVGDLVQRQPLWNIWGYQATHGLGFHEYLQLAEDLGAEPLFCINTGMSHRENVPLDQMNPWVQDALDAIEYANGPTNTVWGGRRAQHGHPAPFGLKYLEVGNENGGPAYQERYALFHDALKTRYPEIQLVANVPTDRRPADIVDEHYYNNPEFFMAQAHRYDTYPRSGPRIFVGEYAVTSGAGQGNLRGAIGEAAFMTGLERNADIVVMASYAPLFVNVNHKRWNPDLINFDSARAYGLPSYYVQQMFSQNRGDVVLPVEVQSPTTSEEFKGGAIGVGTWLTQAEFKDIEVTRGNEVLFQSDFANGLDGWKLLGGDWKAQDGLLRQTSSAENIRAVAGDKGWTDYTYTLKARKLRGAEGFLILFRVQDEGTKSWWNIGGWGNQRHAIEMGGIVGNEVPGYIETGRWYDIRIELRADRIKCYLDGQLIHEVKQPVMQALYASAARVNETGEAVLKVVNASAHELKTDIRLDGVSRVAGPAQCIVLTSQRPTDENSLEAPRKVAPVTTALDIPGSRFEHTFPGNSVTVLRVRPAR